MPFVLPIHRRQDMRGVSRLARRQDKNKFLLYKATRRAFYECVERDMSVEELTAVKGLLKMYYPTRSSARPLSFDILSHLEAAHDRVADNYQRIDSDDAYESVCMFLDTLRPSSTNSDVHAHVYSLDWADFGWLSVQKPRNRKVKVELGLNSQTGERWHRWCLLQQFHRRTANVRTNGRFRYNSDIGTFIMTIHCEEDVAFVKEQLETLFEVRPRRLDFGDEPAH